MAFTQDQYDAVLEAISNTDLPTNLKADMVQVMDKQQRPDDDKPATGTTLWKPFPGSHAYIVYRDLEAVSQACDRNALTYNSWIVDRFGGIVMAVAELYRTDSGPYLRVPIDSSIIPSVPGEVAEEWVFFPKEELDFSKAEQ